MSALASLKSILQGGVRALRDPRVLASLTVPSPSDRERGFRRETEALLGGLPRCVPLEHLLPRTGDILPAFTFLDDTSTVMDLLLLRALARRYGARTMLEIGTFRGESALSVANEGVDVVTLSLPDRTLVERGAPSSWISAHRTMSTSHPAITHVFGDSRIIDTRPYEGWADLLFIDGDHSRDSVEIDTRRFWDTRSARVGAVVWHDGFFSPLLPRWEVLAGIAAAVPQSHRSQLVHVSNTLCVAWLPDGASLPNVERSYVPRAAYSVKVTPLVGWRPTNGADEAHSDGGLPNDIRAASQSDVAEQQ
jgi:hypothetical protein